MYVIVISGGEVCAKLLLCAGVAINRQAASTSTAFHVKLALLIATIACLILALSVAQVSH